MKGKQWIREEGKIRTSVRHAVTCMEHGGESRGVLVGKRGWGRAVDRPRRFPIGVPLTPRNRRGMDERTRGREVLGTGIAAGGVPGVL